MGDSASAPAILCIASFFKGNDFIREAAAQGARVVLLTREKLLGENWARESLDELLAIPGKTSVTAYLAAATHVARTRRVTRVVALEEYDIVTAAHIREHLCVPGLGTTTARCFQDKLAMRAKGRGLGLPQPQFVQLLNYEAIDEFMKSNSPPWMLKPRIGASSMGMRRLSEPEEVWSAIRELDQREALHERSDFHLLEKYEPGNVYHVDSLIVAGEIVFTNVAQYGAPPFDIARGGVNTSGTVPYKSKKRKDLVALNARLLQGFGIDRGVTHAEFIERSDADRKSTRFHFLEVAARVGGAFTAETIEAATGINFWRGGGKNEKTTQKNPYRLPKTRQEYGGIAMSLARQEFPDTSAYDDAEIVLRVVKPNHVGLIIRTQRHQRMIELLDQYVARFSHDFTAVIPAEERAEQHL